jgi:circadian clock protein KaiC
MTSDGLALLDTYLGPSGALVGSARLIQEAKDREALAACERRLEHKQQERALRRRRLEQRHAAERETFETEDARLECTIQQLAAQRDRLLEERDAMARSRQAFDPTNTATGSLKRRRR